MFDFILNPTVLTAFGAVIIIVLAFFKGLSSGANKERVKNLKRDVEVKETNDKIIDDADRAKRDSSNIGLHEDDGFRRKD